MAQISVKKDNDERKKEVEARHFDRLSVNGRAGLSRRSSPLRKESTFNDFYVARK